MIRAGRPDSPRLEGLSPRKREVMEILYRRGEATVAEILEEASLIPSYSAARSVLRSLGQRGLVRHVERGPRYVYRPAAPKERETRSALARILDTFFDGSAERTVKALLDLSRSEARSIDFDELERLIRDAKKQGR